MVVVDDVDNPRADGDAMLTPIVMGDSQGDGAGDTPADDMETSEASSVSESPANFTEARLTGGRGRK